MEFQILSVDFKLFSGKFKRLINEVEIAFHFGTSIIKKRTNIATKIVATLNSTGTPSIYMHAADAIHGDLGTVLDDDVVICISKSGNTPEIKVLVPLIKRGGNILIGMTGNTDSFLAKQSDFVLNTYVEKEACPNNLAPTTSTTAQLVIGDAVAVSLLELRRFSSTDFAKYHPGGALGKKLYLRVDDIVGKNQKPSVSIDAPVKEVIVEISEKMLGATAVLDNKKVVGIITDGDIRRMLKKHDNIGKLTAADIMSKNPKTISVDILAVTALEQMQERGISQLLAIENNEFDKFDIKYINDARRVDALSTRRSKARSRRPASCSRFQALAERASTTGGRRQRIESC